MRKEETREQRLMPDGKLEEVLRNPEISIEDLDDFEKVHPQGHPVGDGQATGRATADDAHDARTEFGNVGWELMSIFHFSSKVRDDKGNGVSMKHLGLSLGEELELTEDVDERKARPARKLQDGVDELRDLGGKQRGEREQELKGDAVGGLLEKRQREELTESK